MVLLAISTPSKLSLFDQDPSQPLQLPTPIPCPTLDGPAVCSAWSKERGAFAVATSEGSVYVWDDAVGRPKELIQVVKGLKVSWQEGGKGMKERGGGREGKGETGWS